MCSRRSKLSLLARRTSPKTVSPFFSKKSARYEPSCAVTPVISARLPPDVSIANHFPPGSPTLEVPRPAPQSHANIPETSLRAMPELHAVAKEIGVSPSTGGTCFP